MEETSGATPTQSQTTATPTTTIGDASAALAWADSSTASPVTETPTAIAAPDATTPAQSTDPAQVPVSTDTSEKPQGEPPEWRWQDIKESLRKKTAEETEARVRQEVEQQYQWAKDFSSIDANERAGLLVWRAALNGDPQAIARIRSNPQALSAIQSLAAQQQQRQAESQDTEPEPDFELPVKDANGNTVGTRPIYSAERQAQREAWLKKQWMSEIRKEIAPLQQTAQELAQEKATATYSATTNQIVTALQAADPKFKAHMPDVWRVIDADPMLTQLALSPKTAAIAIKYAWSEVRRDKVLPAEQQQTEAQVLTKLQQQAVAGAANPAAASASVPKQTIGDAYAALAHAAAVLGG